MEQKQGRREEWKERRERIIYVREGGKEGRDGWKECWEERKEGRKDLRKASRDGGKDEKKSRGKLGKGTEGRREE